MVIYHIQRALVRLHANLRVPACVYDVEGGAIFSKNSTFVFFDGAAWNPRLRSPSPIMAPGVGPYMFDMSPSILFVTMKSVPNLANLGQLKKAYAKSAALRRIRRFVPTEVMMSLYNSFVLPHLEYCSPLLLGVGKVQASRLEDANFYILRSILGYGKTISY